MIKTVAIVMALLLVFCAVSCAAQTVTVTGTATVSGQPETSSVTLTILPKSTVTFALPSSAVSGTPNTTVNFAIQSSTTRLQPAASQFTISAPSATVASFTVTAGAAATAAGKSITCAAPSSPPANTTALNCVVAGVNLTTMANGTVANVAAVLASAAPAGAAAITLSNQTVSNLFGNAIVSSISAPTLTVNVSPTMAMTCAPDTNSVPNAVANQIEPGEVLTCSVTFSSALSAATTVTLSSNDTVSPGATVPSSITVASGASSQTVAITGI